LQTGLLIIGEDLLPKMSTYSLLMIEYPVP
jgi:hypothetical protein